MGGKRRCAMGNDDDGHPWFARLYDPLTGWVEDRVFARHRAYLTEGVSGAVLDVGAGTGAMFPYLDERCGSEATFHAVEPDPHMRRRARAAADREGVEVEIRDARAESLPYEDESFDVVIAALVFCTVDDPERALSEIGRVLRPDGELRFFEHVGDAGWPRRVQRWLDPLWQRAVGGCSLCHETDRLFLEDDRFDPLEFEYLRDGIVPVNPFVRGVLSPDA